MVKQEQEGLREKLEETLQALAAARSSALEADAAAAQAAAEVCHVVHPNTCHSCQALQVPESSCLACFRTCMSSPTYELLLMAIPGHI